MKTSKGSYFADLGDLPVFNEVEASQQSADLNESNDIKQCHFCTGSNHKHSSKICMSIDICSVCLNKIKLYLGSPMVDCFCGSNNMLIPLKYNGVHQSICENHLPFPLSVKLAVELTQSYEYVNAPTIFGNESNYQLIKELSQVDVSQREVDFSDHVKVLVSVIKKIGFHFESVISY